MDDSTPIFTHRFSKRPKRIITIGMGLAGLMVVELSFALSALAQPTAERTLQMQGYMPDVPVSVMIKVIRPELAEVTVVENPPIGWAISCVNYPKYSIVKDGVITWNLPAFKGTRKITYTVTPPVSATETAVFSGKAGNQEIIGTTKIIRTDPEPIGIFQNHIHFGFDYSSLEEYDGQTGEYHIYTTLGSGILNVICGPFLYCKAFGDCSIEAQCESQHPDDPWYHTGGIIIFNSLNTLSCSCVAMETKGVGSDQCWVFDATQSNTGTTYEFGSRTMTEGRFKIERLNNLFKCYNFNPLIQQWVLVYTIKKTFTDPIYIGLFSVCGLDSYTQGIFKDVKLTYQSSPAAINEWELYQ